MTTPGERPSPEIRELVENLEISRALYVMNRIDGQKYASVRDELLAALGAIEEDGKRWKFIRGRLWIIRQRTMADTKDFFLGISPGRGRMAQVTEECHTPEAIESAIDTALNAEGADG